MSELAALRDRLVYLEGVKATRTKTLKDAETEVQALDQKMLHLEMSKKVIGYLMDRMASKDMAEMDKLVTHGMEAVFSDLDLSFRSSIIDSGKKLSILLETLDGGRPVADDAKGSVSVVQSFLLRMLCILKLKKPKFMLLDEAFGAVDSGYIDAVGPLISELCAKFGFDVLLVTHNPGATDCTVLHASLGESKELKLTKRERHAQAV